VTAATIRKLAQTTQKHTKATRGGDFFAPQGEPRLFCRVLTRCGQKSNVNRAMTAYCRVPLVPTSSL
jgi:hypothetical protein